MFVSTRLERAWAVIVGLVSSAVPFSSAACAALAVRKISANVRSVFKKKWQILTAGLGLIPNRKPEMCGIHNALLISTSHKALECNRYNTNLFVHIPEMRTTALERCPGRRSSGPVVEDGARRAT
jgi:hypothetical protein